jgi:DNA polymerase-3 subunit chi
MQVGFYQLSRDPVEVALADIARKTLQSGERMLVVSGDAAILDRVDAMLWERHAEAFLAHGRAGEPHEERQPILLSSGCTPANGARFIALVDGDWRDEALGFERAFLFFDGAKLQAARECWKVLGQREGLERAFWKQEGGKWIKAG